jgi:hypothetical protein
LGNAYPWIQDNQDLRLAFIYVGKIRGKLRNIGDLRPLSVSPDCSPYRGKNNIVWDIPKAFDLMVDENKAMLLKSIMYFRLLLLLSARFHSVALIFDFVVSLFPGG